MLNWLILAGAIIAEVSGSIALKAAVDQPLWYIWVVCGYSIAFLFLDRVLRRGLALGVAYGIWAASGVALTAIMASIIFGEPLTAIMGLGIALIIGGVLLVELGSHKPSTTPEKSA